MALELGALKLGRVAIDGTKLEANASKHKAISYKGMKEDEKRLREQVRRLLERAEAVDAAEDAEYGRDCSGDELPAELARHEERLRRDSRGQAGDGRMGRCRGRSRGQERGRTEAGETGSQGAVQLHRSGIADHEGAGWLRAGLQRADSRSNQSYN